MSTPWGELWVQGDKKDLKLVAKMIVSGIKRKGRRRNNAKRRKLLEECMDRLAEISEKRELGTSDSHRLER